MGDISEYSLLQAEAAAAKLWAFGSAHFPLANGAIIQSHVEKEVTDTAIAFAIRAADGSAAADCATGPGLRAGAALTGVPAGSSSAMHRNLCTASKGNEASNFGAESGRSGLSGGGMTQRRPN
jgi:hypothetical protein